MIENAEHDKRTIELRPVLSDASEFNRVLAIILFIQSIIVEFA